VPFVALGASSLGRVHVVQENGGTRWTLQTENVRRFALTADPRSAAVAALTLDGQTELPVVRAPDSHYCRLDGSTWQVCSGDAQGSWSLTERSPSSSGPVLQVWDRRTAIVIGTTDATAEAAYRPAAAMLASDYFHYSLGAATVLRDVEAQQWDNLTEYNLILLGGPGTNAVAADLESDLPGRALWSMANLLGQSNQREAGLFCRGWVA